MSIQAVCLSLSASVFPLSLPPSLSFSLHSFFYLSSLVFQVSLGWTISHPGKWLLATLDLDLYSPGELVSPLGGCVAQVLSDNT